MSKARDLANAGTALTTVSATELGYLDGVTSAVQTQIDSKLATTTAATTYVSNTNNFVAGKNKIINGDFLINQRVFVSQTTSGQYSFDRWTQFNGGTTGTLTTTPQTFTTGTAPVTGYEGKNYVQCVTASGASADTYAIFAQKIESVRTLAGQTATVSFWAKATSGTPKIGLEISQSFGSGGSPSAEVQTPAGAVTLSTSWTRYSITVAIPSISGKTIGTNNDDSLIVSLWLSAGSSFASRASSIGLQNATFQIWGVQLEQGSTATAFQTATGTIQGELAACQRYYVRWGGDALYQQIGIGIGATGTIASMDVFCPVQMRVVPTAVDYSTLGIQDGTILTGSAVPSIVGIYSGNKTVGIDMTVASGVAVNRPYRFLTNNSTSAYFGLSAEL